MAYYDKVQRKIIYGTGGVPAKPTQPYTIDDYVKTNNQFKKGYDSGSNTAYLTDTKTGKTLSFLSGQGQEYGFGGINNGSNVISDLQKLQSFFDTPAKTETKGPDIPTLNYMANSNNSTNPNNNANNTNNTGFKSDYDKMAFDAYKKLMDRNYQSSYNQDIADILAKIKNGQSFNYDSNTDQGLQAAQDEAQSATSRAAARRGMLYSDSNKSQMGRAALALIPQFRNQAYQEYANNRADTYNQLAAINNLENAAYQRYQGEGTDLYNQANLVSNLANTDYNRYNTDRTYNEGVRQFGVNQGITEAGLTGNYNGQRTMQGEANDLNRMNTLASLTGQIPASQLISQMSPEQIASYKALGNQNGGYAAAINATNDPVQKAIINEFRNQYLQANPNNQYYNTQTSNVMVPTMQGRQLESNLQTEAVQRAGLNITNLMNQYKLDTQMPLETEQAKVLIESGRADLAAKLFQNTVAPEEFKMKMAQVAEQIAASKANTSQGWSQVGIAKQNADTNAAHAGDSYAASMANLAWQKDPSNPDNIYKVAQADASTNKGQPTEANILNQVKGMAQSFKFTPEQQRDYILGSGLSDESKVRILNQMGIPK